MTSTIAELSALSMTSSELRDYATVVAATVALLVFIVNVSSQIRGRRIENLARFNEVHERLFAPESFLGRHLATIEQGTAVRDRNDPEMESRFHRMLLEIERLAILANNFAVPRETQVYMFGSYAPRILALMTEDELDSMYWELAREYLKRVADDARRYAGLAPDQRARFWK